VPLTRLAASRGEGFLAAS